MSRSPSRGREDTDPSRVRDSPRTTACAEEDCPEEPACGDTTSRPEEKATTKSLTAKIEELKRAQAEARDLKRRATKELKLARRKKTRILKKARLLTTEDLVAFLGVRTENVSK